MLKEILDYTSVRVAEGTSRPCFKVALLEAFQFQRGDGLVERDEGIFAVWCLGAFKFDLYSKVDV